MLRYEFILENIKSSEANCIEVVEDFDLDVIAVRNKILKVESFERVIKESKSTLFKFIKNRNILTIYKKLDSCSLLIILPY